MQSVQTLNKVSTVVLRDLWRINSRALPPATTLADTKIHESSSP